MTSSKLTIAITGVSGLLGSALAKYYLENGHRVKGLVRKTSDLSLLDEYEGRLEKIEGDINDYESLSELIGDDHIVIHTAAIVTHQTDELEKLDRINHKGTIEVLNACSARKGVFLVHLSSIAALGFKDTVKVYDEKATWEENENNSYYGKSKHLAETQVWRAFEEGLAGCIVNPSVIIGDGNWGNSSTQLFRQIHKFPSITTEGTLSLVDVRDVVAAISGLVEKRIVNERFVLHGENVPVKKVYEIVNRSLKRPIPKITLGNAGMQAFRMLMQALGWLSGNPSGITKDTIKALLRSTDYSTKKIETTLEGFSFRPISEALEYFGPRVAKRNTKKG